MGLRLLCIGSPFGADAVAWAVGKRLSELGLPAGCEVRLLDRPGLQLLEEMRDAETVLLLDAARGIAPGRLHRVESLDELGLAGQSSSHGIGVAEALRLAEQLGQLPERLSVFAIGAGAALPPESTLAALATQLLGEIKKGRDAPPSLLTLPHRGRAPAKRG
ncbi:hydrogenase maturation protease [Sulfuritortus calidifontis]|uniref:Hydrogenase maturation protease n=1 Tax=Sulfuritortus calidifontis TaxID=1914471 RepID=A0A4R3JZI9_9PROT|nr:hydrogenase maturation protease [Sulfuritortus calidifontis]TCS73280.1 hydrogenase maturation protease [Sulfuritortus calidifontis]